MINFEIKQDIVKPVIDKRNIDKVILEDEEELFPEGKRIIDEMKVNFDISREFTKNQQKFLEETIIGINIVELLLRK